MPDVYSIGLGGGSHIQINDEGIEIGPISLGNQTFQQSMAFGGKQLTLTDVALALENIDISGAKPKNVKLSYKGCKLVMDEAIKGFMNLSRA